MDFISDMLFNMLGSVPMCGAIGELFGDQTGMIIGMTMGASLALWLTLKSRKAAKRKQL